ncbi:MAG: VOC family protein [Gemmatimonadaceae bacterium]|nr:VOC family protein [Caulobacter sp.]
MAKVLGLGGLFFKAEDPAAVRAWYARVLGFEVHDWGATFNHPKTGAVSWAPFAADTGYFEPSDASFMINFIVDDLDGVLARAAAEGVEPTGRQDENLGRFAWLIDPAGVKIELWQPAPEEA